MSLMRSTALFLTLAALAAAQPRPTVFLITDAEGVGGVCRQDQVEPSNREMQQLLTAEINAAVQGFLDGGAGEVIVWDGHDGSQTLSTLTIHPRAKLVNKLMGNPERLLGAVLLGNTLVDVLAASLASSLAITLVGDVGVVYATGILTILIVIFSAVLPKTYALAWADGTALRLAPIMRCGIRLGTGRCGAVGNLCLAP